MQSTRSKDIVIIPFQLSWDWCADYQRQTCLELARQHTVIAYIHNDARFFTKQKPHRRFGRIHNVIFYQPTYVIPFRRFAAIEEINQLLALAYLSWRYGHGTTRVILWIFDPVFWFYPHVRRLYPNTVSLYDCVDYIWSRNRTLRQIVQYMEEKLILGVDHFFVNSHILRKLHKKVRYPDIVTPQGFRLREFMCQSRPRVVFPHDKPIVGYVGAINHRIDFVLLEQLVKNNTEWRFVLWGPIQEIDRNDLNKTTQLVETLKKFPNLIIGESKESREIATIVSQFDIGIIPYTKWLAAVRNSFPMKLFEYFYVGLPVLSSDIIELRRYSSFVRIAKSPKEWSVILRELLSGQWPSRYKLQEKQLAVNTSWNKKIQSIMRTISKQDKLEAI